MGGMSIRKGTDLEEEEVIHISWDMQEPLGLMCHIKGADIDYMTAEDSYQQVVGIFLGYYNLKNLITVLHDCYDLIYCRQQ